MKFIHPGGGWWKPWLVSIAFSTLYALVAGFLGSYFSPQAGGRWVRDCLYTTLKKKWLQFGQMRKSLLKPWSLKGRPISVQISVPSMQIQGLTGNCKGLEDNWGGRMEFCVPCPSVRSQGVEAPEHVV
eukprot:scaffold37374_cov20-Tisochrysis_lutea.AAC.1